MGNHWRADRWECPECGATMQFGSGCKHCPSCGYSVCGRMEVLKAGSSVMLMVMIVSLMTWCSIPKYDTKSPTTYLTKEQIVDLQKKQLEAQEIKDKKQMEARSK